MKQSADTDDYYRTGNATLATEILRGCGLFNHFPDFRKMV
jgi:hypothetical protein